MAGYEDLLALVERARNLLLRKEDRLAKELRDLESFNCDFNLTKKFNEQKIDVHKEKWLRFVCYKIAADCLDEIRENKDEIERDLTLFLKTVDCFVLKPEKGKEKLKYKWYSWFLCIVHEIAFEMVLEENKDVSSEDNELTLFGPFMQLIKTLIKEHFPFNEEGIKSILKETLSIVICEEMKELAALDPLFSKPVETLVQHISKIEEDVGMYYNIVLPELSKIKRGEILDALCKLILNDNENLTQNVNRLNESYSDKERKISECYAAMSMFIPIFLKNEFVNLESSHFLEISSDFNLLNKNLRETIKTIDFAENECFSIDRLKQLQNSGCAGIQEYAIVWLGSLISNCKDLFSLAGRVKATELQKKEGCQFVDRIETFKIPIENIDNCKLQVIKSLVIRCTTERPNFRKRITLLPSLCKVSFASATYDNRSGIKAVCEYERECDKANK